MTAIDLDRFLHDAKTTYRVLMQDKVWYPKDRGPITIAGMDPAWRYNTANWLLRRANHFAFYGSYGEAAWMPRPEDTGEMAYESLQQDAARSGREAAAHPEAWLKATPLYKALVKDLPENVAELAKHWSTCDLRTGQGDACDCGCRAHECLICHHESCGWCPDCSPGVPDWTIS